MPVVFALGYLWTAVASVRFSQGKHTFVDQLLFGRELQGYQTIHRLINGKPEPRRPPLDVSITDGGQPGWAIYGTVRVGGVNVIP